MRESFRGNSTEMSQRATQLLLTSLSRRQGVTFSLLVIKQWSSRRSFGKETGYSEGTTVSVLPR